MTMTVTNKRLNDNDRYPIKDSNDSRLKFLGDMGTSFKKMDNSVSGHRIRGLTSDTSNALHQTLNGFVELIKTLLLSNFIYVMSGHVQSDRMKGKFGIYRQGSGGNFLISAG